MECRKGRRKGLLSGLVFAWLLTSGCTVAARNIGKCESIYDSSARRPIPPCNLSSAWPSALSLCQLSPRATPSPDDYARIFTCCTTRACSEPAKNYFLRRDAAGPRATPKAFWTESRVLVCGASTLCTFFRPAMVIGNEQRGGKWKFSSCRFRNAKCVSRLLLCTELDYGATLFNRTL